MDITIGSVILALSVFSYLGEALRDFLEKVLGSSCSNPGTVSWDESGWAACLTADGTDLMQGTNGFTGGGTFTDLPINMIGCFIMGFFVIGNEAIGLPVDMPIAFLPRKHFFQKWTIWHIGIRTGFCGSLTTFASWNTQMVIMLIGGRKATDVGSSQWFTVLFGYIIGLVSSLACYQTGIHAAISTHRFFNKDLAKEADILQERIGTDLNVYRKNNKLFQRDLPDFERKFLNSISRSSMMQSKRKVGRSSSRGRESIHRDLPNSERRFLHDIHEEENQASPEEGNFDDATGDQRSSHTNDQPRNSVSIELGTVSSSADMKKGSDSFTDSREGRKNIMQSNDTKQKQQNTSTHISGINMGASNDEAFAYLQKWKETTDKHRKGLVDNGGTFQNELQEIEHAILIENKEPREEVLNIARDFGWDVDALREWKRERQQHNDDIVVTNSTDKNILNDYEFIISLFLFVVLTALLLWGAIVVDYTDSVTNKTRKTSFLSALLSPLGTITRWRLSKLNGYVTSPKWKWVPFGTLAANLIGSIISALVRAITLRSEDDITHIWMGALKTGFAGCLSTVSTFAAETTNLMKLLPQQSYGYYYSIGSLILGCIFGVVSYAWAV